MTTAIVLGSAPCMWDDLEGARAFAPDADLVVVNEAGISCLDRITHWCSLHGGKLKNWVATRLDRGGNADFTAHGLFHPYMPSEARFLPTFRLLSWERPSPEGSSGLFAAIVASVFYDNVILAGVPLDGKTVIDVNGEQIPAPNSGVGYHVYQVSWPRAVDRGDLDPARLSSMSGWTRELFGAPE